MEEAWQKNKIKQSHKEPTPQPRIQPFLNPLWAKARVSWILVQCN